MAIKVGLTRSNKEEREKALILKHKFERRITIAKHGKESMDAGDYGNALKKFIEYLSIQAEAKAVKDLYSLKTSHFDAKKEITEMLMISHIYFEMARMYDAVPKFAEDSKKCLAQFVHFTANQPYQVVNSELIRKYIRKTQFKNAESFNGAYQEIFVQSKKCYVVTYCYGEDHPVTADCREFKNWLLTFSHGHALIQAYYQISTSIIDRWGHHFLAKSIAKYIISPLILLFSKVILPAILK